ncbi:glycogen debranching enzyme [Ixodes scapularis]|uniref:glycogen debranching enzyme n=1 Tax=Ixodes scapularis TaxID=6945 RepID=UPI001C381444|nr:glycogen debranching enzyme [Ixodes scapularis]
MALDRGGGSPNEETLNSAAYSSGIFATFASARERRAHLMQQFNTRKFYRSYTHPPKPPLVASLESNGISEHAMHMANWSDSEAVHPSFPINVFALNYGVLESTIYRLPKKTRVRFILGPSLYGKKPTLYMNVPPQPNVGFERNKYHKVPWSHDVHNPGDETAYFADVVFSTAGSFHYYFVCDDDATPGNAGSGYFLVDPVLRYGDGEELPLDCIQCQTVLSKCLGPLDSWLPKLRVAHESGYNFVHLSPIQELGASRSSYCIRDHRRLNPDFSHGVSERSLKDVAKIVDTMCREWKVLTLTDVVLNHVANETPWIREHPECTYNLKNSPHMKPAFLLDVALHCFTLEIAEGKWEAEGVPPTISKEEHLDALRRIVNLHWLPLLQLHEFYTINVDALVDVFHQKVIDLGAPTSAPLPDKPLTVVHHPEFLRNGSTVDMDIALRIFNRNWEPDSPDAPHQIGRCCGELRRCLEQLNGTQWGLLHSHLQAAVENVVKGCRYLRLQHDGPRKQAVSRANPLVGRYFVVLTDVPVLNLKEAEKLMFSERAAFVMAHNGWVMNDDPLRNFAEPGSNVYLRRELIAWGDNVKLRYGSSPEDCPFLWNYMKEYVCESAQLFHGLRLDNCHSTPLPLAEYVLDAARKVRPDLYVIAELFTSREEVDNLFVNRLGINSLIREAMSAPDARELGRLVYRFGGDPVGSFLAPPVRPLAPCVAHALFMDMTHDNPSPFEKRSPYDVLPSAAVVAMACCGTGSSRGYDEMVPHHIHVVEEEREFLPWGQAAAAVHLESGIVAAKRALNQLHFELGKRGYRHVYVDQVDGSIISITRHCLETHQSVVLVARTAFQRPSNPLETGCIPPLCIPGVVDEIVFEAHCVRAADGAPFAKHEKFVNGSAEYQLEMREHISLHESKMVELSEASEAHINELDFSNFPPGSVIAFRVSMHATSKAAVQRIRHHLASFGYDYFEETVQAPQAPRAPPEDSLPNIAAALTLSDLNRVLFRSDAEERAEGRNCGAYCFQRFGTLVYCGLQGLMSVLSEVRSKNDLGHPMCDNLRAGDWLMDYIVARLAQEKSTLKLSQWFEKVFASVRLAPRYLIPCYFDAAVTSGYTVLLEEIWQKMSDFVKHGSTLVRELALGSVVLAGFVPGAHLPPLSKQLVPPLPPHRMQGDRREEVCTTLAAGLPHFAAGYMRNWGRDTFISLRGLLLLTGRHQEARFLLLAFGGCLRHGLIPNLLDKGTHARYNCRDAVWWWLQSVQDYCKEVPQGYLLLKDRVARLYPTDDSPPQEPGAKDMPLEEVIQEAIQRHFEGISFRERNAGYQIDSQMTHEGFNVEAGVDLRTGFVRGGNAHNCGTWMDKMGSSEKAGNKGHPATPRNGSAVELVGLCKSTLRWLDQMYKEGFYPYNAVEKTEHGVKTVMTFDQWGSLIKKHFEGCFWVPPANEPTSPDDLHPHLTNRRCIYKDCYGAAPPWSDYQLRPNFPIAMVLAPELFTVQRAWEALKVVREVLVGPFGMKTLDPSDLNYNGYYSNSNDSNDYKVAHGFNYHQGPEWLWPMGYYLRARLYFAHKVANSEAALQEVQAEIREVLANNGQLIQASPWRGLPELTNRNGDPCLDSCPIQAWSHACLLEVLYDMQKI